MASPSEMEMYARMLRQAAGTGSPALLSEVQARILKLMSARAIRDHNLRVQFGQFGTETGRDVKPGEEIKP